MRRVVLAVALVALAGCSGLVPGPEPTPTATPAPVPTVESLPPGVGHTGLTDPGALAERHAAHLREAGFTLVTNRTVQDETGALRSAFRTELGVTESRNYALNATARGPDAPVFLGDPPASAQFWAKDGQYLQRRSAGNRTEFGAFQPSVHYLGAWRLWIGSVALDQRPSADARSTLESFETEVEGRSSVRGQSRVHLVGQRLTSAAFVDEHASIQNVRRGELRAVVTRSGFVVAYGVWYTGTTEDGETVRVSRIVRYLDVGNTTIERPSWYDEAVEEAD